jgi:CheY-like chemotaxis protein
MTILISLVIDHHQSKTHKNISLKGQVILIGQMGMKKNIRILLVEDNPGDAYLIEDHLEEFANFSYELKNVGTLSEGLSILKNQPFDVILSDLSLPDSDGINTFLRIHAENPLIPLIILSGSNDEEIGAYAVKNGAHDYFVKGQTDGRILECINTCISSIQLDLMI